MKAVGFGVQRWAGAGAFGDVTTEANVSDGEFTSFVESHGLRLRRVMVAQFGVDVGGDSAGAESGTPDLASALRALPHRQRVAVLMVYAYGWTPQELGQMTGVPAATVRSHLRRGLIALRHALAKGDDR